MLTIPDNRPWMPELERLAHERGLSVQTLVEQVLSDYVGNRTQPDTSLDALWAEFDALAADIGRQWPADVSALDAVREQRREL